MRDRSAAALPEESRESQESAPVVSERAQDSEPSTCLNSAWNYFRLGRSVQAEWIDRARKGLVL